MWIYDFCKIENSLTKLLTTDLYMSIVTHNDLIKSMIFWVSGSLL